MPRAFASRPMMMLLVCSFLPALYLYAQPAFRGRLDPGLHVDPRSFVPTILDPLSFRDAQKLRIEAVPSDKIFAGELAFPRGGRLRYKAVIVRHADATDVLYLDRNRDGRFEPNERVTFRADTGGDPRLKSSVTTRVDLPGALFSTAPMQVGLMRDGIRGPARPDQLAVGYTALLFVQGRATLPGRTVSMRFQYNAESQSISSHEGVQWVDINGDGTFDLMPGSGEYLHADGAPPVFTIGTRRLEVSSIDVKAHTFALAAVSAAEDHRIPLAIGAQLPDFSYEDFSGTRHHLSELKGRYLLLDFWATWCAPCMAELPKLKESYTAYHPHGLEILGIDGDRSPGAPKAAVEQQQLVWPQARYDADLLDNQFQISIWPTLVLVDLSGGHRTIVSVGLPDHLPLDISHLDATLSAVLGH